jgi:hypothetical protein
LATSSPSHKYPKSRLPTFIFLIPAKPDKIIQSP